MNANAEQIAADWTALARHDPNKAPNDIFESGWVIYDAADNDPALCWEAIKAVVGGYSDDDVLSEHDTEAKRILGNTAAGPLENLLANYGADFIESVEVEARRERKMRWALGCVWQNSMPDDIWLRVQKAAGSVFR